MSSRCGSFLCDGAGDRDGAGRGRMVPSPRYPQCVAGLKFSAALPQGLARETLAERLEDRGHARVVVEAARAIVKL